MSRDISEGSSIHRIARVAIASLIALAALGAFLVLYLPRGTYDPYAREAVADAHVTPCATIGHLNIEGHWETSETVSDIRTNDLSPPIADRTCSLIREGCVDVGPSSSVANLYVSVRVLHHVLDAYIWYEYLRGRSKQGGNLIYPHYREYSLDDGEAFGVHVLAESLSVVVMHYDRGVFAVGGVSCNDPRVDLDGLWTYVASQLNRDAAWADYYS